LRCSWSFFKHNLSFFQIFILFLIIVSLLAKENNLLTNLDVPCKDNVVHINFIQLCRFPNSIVDYLKGVIELARNAIYSDNGFKSKYYQELDKIGFETKKKLEELYCYISGQNMLENDLLELVKSEIEVKNLLKETPK